MTLMVIHIRIRTINDLNKAKSEKLKKLSLKSLNRREITFTYPKMDFITFEVSLVDCNTYI